jgi:hypothetical protein
MSLQTWPDNETQVGRFCINVSYGIYFAIPHEAADIEKVTQSFNLAFKTRSLSGQSAGKTLFDP